METRTILHLGLAGTLGLAACGGAGPAPSPAALPTPPAPAMTTSVAPAPGAPSGASSASPAPTGTPRTLAGTIVSYECADNCYLVVRDTTGSERTGLCAAPACRPWNQGDGMPASFVGRKVVVRVGTGQQVSASGDVMGEMDAFTDLSFE